LAGGQGAVVRRSTTPVLPSAFLLLGFIIYSSCLTNLKYFQCVLKV
jgi:hypothetical protein